MLIIASYGEDGTPDEMNAAWGGVANSSRVAMYLSGGHKTVKNILKRGAFTVSMGDAEHAAACDYVGIESGNSVPDKVARAGFHVTKSEHVDAPVIDEFPLALECKLVSYDEETRLLTGEIVNVSVDERALDENGKLAVEKLNPAVRHGTDGGNAVISFVERTRRSVTAADVSRSCAVNGGVKALRTS